MDNKEIIVIEDRLYKDSSVSFEFVTPEDNMPYNGEVVTMSAKKFVDTLNSRVSFGLCAALAKQLREAGY